MNIPNIPWGRNSPVIGIEGHGRHGMSPTGEVRMETRLVVLDCIVCLCPSPLYPARFAYFIYYPMYACTLYSVLCTLYL